MPDISYEIHRSNRRTIAIAIKSDRTVLVRCPQRMSLAQIESFVSSKRQWIMRQLGKCPVSVQKLTQQEQAELKRMAAQKIGQSVARFAPVVGVSYNGISLRWQKTRWGSCSAKGNLNFNCLLALAPAEVLDYVVVHELCHRKEMNHSAKFWAEVSRVLPDYKTPRLWLKKNGAGLTARLP